MAGNEAVLSGKRHLLIDWILALIYLPDSSVRPLLFFIFCHGGNTRTWQFVFAEKDRTVADYCVVDSENGL